MSTHIKKKIQNSDLSIGIDTTQKFSAGVYILIKIFGLGFWVYLVLNKIIYGTQKLLYQRPGEILAGSGKLLIFGLLLIGCSTYFLIIWESELEKKFSPRFYKYFNPECNELDKSSKRKITKTAGFLIPFSLFFIIFFLNEYISLGDNYIAASSASLFPNRKEYVYSDIAISKERIQNSWTYIYRFPDGKKISNIWDGFGISDAKFVKMINERQNKLGQERALIVAKTAKQKASPPNLLSYLVTCALYFFLAWTLAKLFKKKKK